MLNFNEFDLVGIAQAIREKKFSAYELAQESIRRLKTAGQQYNAVFSMNEEGTLARAQLLDKIQEKNEPLGLLHGVPLGHKDLIAVVNQRMHVGSTILENNVSEVHSLVNERLESAGQLNVASLHMAEFALSPTGFNQHYGHGKNPWNPLSVSGGSSSGSGIALALRLLFGSIGSDTGGSIRHPSAMCGITGLKPTNGLVPADGVFPLSTSLDCVGPMAQSVRDCARLLTVVTGQVIDYESYLSLPVSGLKIGIPRSYFNENLDTSVENCWLEAKATFKSLKIELVEVDVPNMQMINQNMGIVLAYEAFQLHQKWLQQFPMAYADQVRARIELGRDLSLTAYEQAIEQRSIMQEAVQSHWFSYCDAILVPTLQIETPSIEATTKGSTAEILSNLMRVTQNTKSINYLSLPALSLPAGFTKAGLPIGMQLIGNQFAEEKLLQIGNAFQKVTKWHQQVPKITVLND